MKKLLSISVIAIFAIAPTFADNEPTVIPTPANCNEAVLNTTEGSADLEAIYTANTINTTWYSGYGNNASVANATQCSYDGTINLPQTNPSRPGYAFNGWKLKTCNIPSQYVSTDGTHSYGHGWENNADYCYIDGVSGSAANCSSMTDLALNEWKVEFSYGTVRGIASCQPTLPADIAYIEANLDSVTHGQMDANTFLTEYTAIAGAEKGAIAQQLATAYYGNDLDTADILFYQLRSMPGDTNYTTNSTGQYCWCKATHYTANGASQCPLSSLPWVFLASGDSASACARGCSSECANRVEDNSGTRVVLFGASQ